ncbi:MAG: nucleotide exchange factor GrpE [Thermodesulfobacteriota bacterium]
MEEKEKNNKTMNIQAQNFEENDLTDLTIIQDDLIQLIRQRYQLQDDIKNKTKSYYKEMKDNLLKFLDVIDAFDRVFENIQSREKEMNQQMRIWVGNFKSVRRLLFGKLKEIGVNPIEAPAGKAIPGLYTIVETKQMPHLEKDTILEEIEKGYLWHDEVLRKAKVITVKN